MSTTDAPNTDPLELTPEQLGTIAEKKATCPFVACAVTSGALPVRNSADKPLAAIEDIVALIDAGGGDLGRRLLRTVARGNHSRMQGPSGELDAPTPDGMMSLDLAGSQGAHPGHSGILLGDPTQIDAGRFSAADFERLSAHANADGYLSEKAVGAFIADNLARDPSSKILPIGRLAMDLLGVTGEIGDKLIAMVTGKKTERDEVELLEKLTKLAGEDNLVGAAGEYGLLFAFLANRPDPDRKADAGIRLADVEQMMVHHRFPDGWEDWAKNLKDWLHSTTKIAFAAAKTYFKDKF